MCIYFQDGKTHTKTEKSMTQKELFKRYGIKLPHDLGKPLYVQNIEIKKQFFQEIWKRIGALIFVLFGSMVSLVLAYSTWQTHDVWHGIIALFFSGFLFATAMLVRSFLHVTLYAVADKGIARYTLHLSKRLIKTELCYFSPSMQCEIKEGYVDPHSPISKKGYKIEALWKEENRTLFSLSYLKDEEPKSDKEAFDEAVKAFRMYHGISLSNHKAQ